MKPGMKCLSMTLSIQWLLSLLSVISISRATDIAPSSSSSYTTSYTMSMNSTSSVNASSTYMPTPSSMGEQSFVQENLGLIIGVPTGLGLSIIGFIACFIYCGVSAMYQNYRENRDTRNTSGTADYGRGTGSTGVRSNMYTSGGPSNNSAYQPSAFEPSSDQPSQTISRENTSTV